MLRSVICPSKDMKMGALLFRHTARFPERALTTSEAKMQADGASAGPVRPVPARADRRSGGFSPLGCGFLVKPAVIRSARFQEHLEARLRLSAKPREERQAPASQGCWSHSV